MQKKPTCICKRDIFTRITTEALRTTRSVRGWGRVHTVLLTTNNWNYCYGVASTSKLLKIIGLICRISSLLQGSFAKETYIFKEPTNRSHPIVDIRFKF